MDPQEIATLTTPYINPFLEVKHSQTKGRLVVPTCPIEPGTILMVDLPYGLVPAPSAHNPPFRICCNDNCHRRIPARDTVVRCVKDCVRELSWCSEQCREINQTKHAGECAWLRQYGTKARKEKGEMEFELVWLLARILIRKSHESITNTTISFTTTPTQTHWDHRGWKSVRDLAGSPSWFPAEEVAQWTDLVNSYLVGRIEGVQTTTEEVLGLICRIETNSFGLYPGVTGVYPVSSWEGRGDYYGSGLYPVAAMFNHACCPNVNHQLDPQNRRIFRANSTILPGQECCISYFDLVEFRDSRVRREEIRSKWTFVCDCQRCKDDQAAEEEVPDFLAGMMDRSSDVDSDEEKCR